MGISQAGGDYPFGIIQHGEGDVVAEYMLHQGEVEAQALAC
ncbi:hypothetical protein J3E64_003158 [Sphingobium sp. OAS761]|nr:hypothetical protein [Sphingobium sp. OAS761]